MKGSLRVLRVFTETAVSVQIENNTQGLLSQVKLKPHKWCHKSLVSSHKL